MTSNKFGDYTPSKSNEEVINITLGVFFDGTLNNKTNTTERRNKTTAYNKHGGKASDNNSYNNDWSNVARLWDNYDKNFGIYIEGIGTDDKKDDATLGYAFGTGETGIRGKVRKGCVEISKKVKEIKNSKKATKISVLTFDVFGFSRGSAAARNFVHEIGKSKYKPLIYSPPVQGAQPIPTDSDGYYTTLKELPKWGHLGLQLQEAGIIVEVLRIRFLGIYDTVSSYSKNFSLSPNFSNDVAELGLNDIGRAKTIIHFVADNEHRENFDLTHVHSGIEKKFPGVHCDIGGAYENYTEVVKELETSWTLRNNLEPFRNQLVEQGWYKDKQLEYTGGNVYWALQGTRYLLKTYSYIPLHFMADYISLKGIRIDKTQISNKYKISDNPLLVRVKAKLKSYVMGNGQPYSFKWFKQLQETYKGSKIPEQRYAEYQKEVQEQKDLRELRNGYLHWSAKREGIGMDPRKDRKRVTHW